MLLAVGVFLSACSSEPTGEAPGAVAAKDGIEAAVASYDLAVGRPARFLVGLFGREKENIGYGAVELDFSYLGQKDDRTRRAGPSATASFLSLPGSAPAPPVAGPAVLPTGQGRGVYAAEVGFDRSGFWEVTATADLEGSGRRSSTAAFEVLSEHAVPAPGDQAPATETLTLASTDVAPAAIDSRASATAPVPDPELHQISLAQALRAGRPVLAVFSTPTFCVSRFCGPVTDMVADLARTHADRAAYIHVEIWKDFERKELNEAAAAWLTRDGGDGNEPWVFLIAADGRIIARWDNVATRGEIEPLLEALPPLP